MAKDAQEHPGEKPIVVEDKEEAKKDEAVLNGGRPQGDPAAKIKADKVYKDKELEHATPSLIVARVKSDMNDRFSKVKEAVKSKIIKKEENKVDEKKEDEEEVDIKAWKKEQHRKRKEEKRLEEERKKE